MPKILVLLVRENANRLRPHSDDDLRLNQTNDRKLGHHKNMCCLRPSRVNNYIKALLDLYHRVLLYLIQLIVCQISPL